MPNNIAPTTPSPLSPAIAHRHQQTLEHLHQIARGSLLHHHLKCGEYLLTNYYDGDSALYADKSRGKEAGFEALLSQHRDALTEMGLKPSLLRDCVRAYIVWRGLHPQLREQLGFSGLVALAPMADLGERELVASEAIQKHWTSRQIGEAVLAENKAHKKGKKKLGRPTLPAGLKHALKVVRAGKGLPTQVSQVKHLSDAQRKELHAGAVHLRDKLDKLIAALSAPTRPEPVAR